MNAQIIDRGRGPEIAGTRVTVCVVWEYARAGRDEQWIAQNLRLSPQQIRSAMEYIKENQPPIEDIHQAAQERINKGNPAWVEQRLAANRQKFDKFVASCRDGCESEKVHHAADHVRQ